MSEGSIGVAPGTPVAAPAPDESPETAGRPSAAPDHRYTWAAVAVAVLSAVASYVIYRRLFPLGSGDLDEGVYVFQAQMLLHGLVSLPAARYGEFFRPWLTGERDGRIFTEYQLGLPAFLAGSQLLLGSMRAGLALVAGATVLAMYGFALELLDERKVALLAAIFLALSPIFLVQSALVLTYTLTLCCLTGAGWAVLRGVRTGRRRYLFAGGLALGAGLLTRPVDTVLFGAPLVVFALWRLRREATWGAAAARLLVPVAAGIVPFVALTGWYNWQATGSPLAFPNDTADPLNTFGFGERRLMEGQPKIAYSGSDAYRALLSNLHLVPSWTFGGAVMLVLALFALLKLRLRAETVLLVVVALAFPVGYFFWWATALSAATGENGIGPHYYVPSFVPVLVLGAFGFVRLVEHRGRLVVVAAAAVLVAVTAYAVPDKLRVNNSVTRGFERTDAAVPSNLDHALVFLDTKVPTLILSQYPFFQTDPDLTGPVVFAADRGIANVALIDQMSDRRAYWYREQLEPGDQLLAPTGGLTEIHVVSARQLVVRVQPLLVPRGDYTRAYVTAGDHTTVVDLGRSAGGPGAVTTFRVVPAGSTARGRGVLVLPDAATGSLSVGVAYSPSARLADPTRYESRLPYGVADGTITALTPGLGWARVVFPSVSLWLPMDVHTYVDLRFSGRP